MTFSLTGKRELSPTDLDNFIKVRNETTESLDFIHNALDGLSDVERLHFEVCRIISTYQERFKVINGHSTYLDNLIGVVFGRHEIKANHINKLREFLCMTYAKTVEVKKDSELTYVIRNCFDLLADYFKRLPTYALETVTVKINSVEEESIRMQNLYDSASDELADMESIYKSLEILEKEGSKCVGAKLHLMKSQFLLSIDRTYYQSGQRIKNVLRYLDDDKNRVESICERLLSMDESYEVGENYYRSDLRVFRNLLAHPKGIDHYDHFELTLPDGEIFKINEKTFPWIIFLTNTISAFVPICVDILVMLELYTRYYDQIKQM